MLTSVNPLNSYFPTSPHVPQIPKRLYQPWFLESKGGKIKVMGKAKLPKFLEEYFWDVDFKKIDKEQNASYIIHRLLDKGDDRAIGWMFKTYDKNLIKEVVTTRRGFSPKTANFWADLLDIDKRKVVCLQKPYLKMRQQLWPY